MVKSPCQNCEDRRPACHDGCERYKEFKQGLDRIKEEKKKYYGDYAVYIRDQNMKIIRKKQQMGSSKFF